MSCCITGDTQIRGETYRSSNQTVLLRSLELNMLLSKFPRNSKFKCLKVSSNCSAAIIEPQMQFFTKAVSAAILSLCVERWLLVGGCGCGPRCVQLRCLQPGQSMRVPGLFSYRCSAEL